MAPTSIALAGRTGPRADLFGLLAILAVTTTASLYLLSGGTLVGQDAATQFYPWYGYLGQQLRAFEIPGWNPFQFAGAPFAADPQSGWTYVPAMVLFGLFPLHLAVPALLWLHLALAGYGTYLLARALRMPVAAAVVAATAYQLTGPVLGRSACCPAATEIAVWTPWVMAGAELAIRAGERRHRFGGWVLAGFALSQALATWLGQGSYYVLLALAGYIGYRTLITPPGRPGAIARVGAAAMHGLAIGLIGFGLAAASVLPRLDYVARSNLAGGEYAGQHAWAAKISGVRTDVIVDRLLTPTLYYPGTATMVLALAGLVLARGRFAAPYFGFLGLAAAMLALPEVTLVHRVLFAVLPRFEALHRHWPERTSLVAYLAPSLLAGATVAVLMEHVTRSQVRRVMVVVPALAAIVLWIVGAGVPPVAIVAAAMTVALSLALLTAPAPVVRRAIAVVLVTVIAAELLIAARTNAAQAPYGGFHRVDIGEYFGSSGAAEYIAQQTEHTPARSFGYDPSMWTIEDGQTILYRNDFADPASQALNVNNRAMVYGLHDIQGYNPIQVRRYSELMTALNGRAQDYHDANVFPTGLTSPLLDLLNVRYVVIPADAPYGQASFHWLIENFSPVYEDEDVIVLENPEALPRAWVVHDVRQVTPGAALEQLASGSVDPRTTALIEEAPPPVTMPAEPSVDRVVFLEHEPDRVEVHVTNAAAGMVVFSEIFDPGWQASVDGVATPIHLVNHVLRGIPLGAGSHRIELRYETPALLLGMAITGVTAAILIAAAVVLRLGPPGRRVGRGRKP